jgi:hypothetical protein
MPPSYHGLPRPRTALAGVPITTVGATVEDPTVVVSTFVGLRGHSPRRSRRGQRAWSAVNAARAIAPEDPNAIVAPVQRAGKLAAE